MAVIRKQSKLPIAGAVIAPTSRKRTVKRRSTAPASLIKMNPLCTKFLEEHEKYETESLWKPTKIPAGFILAIDTREQKPLFVNSPETTVPIKQITLTTGDYAIVNYKDSACVERKMLSDLDAFIGRERDEYTIPKLERMRDMMWAALVIECSPRKLCGKRKYGKITKEHVRGFLKKCRVQYGIHVFVSDDREEIERFVLDHLCYVFEGLIK